MPAIGAIRPSRTDCWSTGDGCFRGPSADRRGRGNHGLTVEGRRVINILALDLRLPTNERKAKLRILRLYKRYQDDAEVQALYFDAFGFPDDLPDLSAHSRATNAKPEGVAECYLRQRQAGTLPRTYGV